MSIVSKDFARRMTRFAIRNNETTLTAVLPATGEVYKAARQSISTAFEIFEHGQEESADTQFFIAQGENTREPVKGDILTDGETEFKVMNVRTDSLQSAIRIECASRYARTR
jgi:hypothetical protein